MVEISTVVVTGSSGMLGQDLVPALEQHGFRVVRADLPDFDITDETKVAGLATFNPDAIINCAAYTAVDRAETDREKCEKVNVDGVRILSAFCRKQGVILVQLSTDYVFDGSSESYDENSPRSPLNHYGWTKAEAEKLTEELERHYIVRTSWLFGVHGENFVKKVQRICAQDGRISLVNDQKGRPTYTKDLARAIIALFEKPFGTYHLTNSGACTWYEFGCFVAGLCHPSCDVKPCTSAEFSTLARRPAYSVLNNNKAPPLRDWKEAVQAYLEET